MNNSRISLFEVLGIIGVFAGLLLVAYELRQNSIASQAQTRATLTVIAHDMIRSVSTPELIAIRQKENNGESLNELEQAQLQLNIAMQLRSAENVFYQYRIGTLSNEEFTGYRIFYKRSFTDSPSWRLNWDNTKEIYSPLFQEEIDLLIREIENQP
jgi:hypothetical protein